LLLNEESVYIKGVRCGFGGVNPEQFEFMLLDGFSGFHILE
jgi:hypothetical protein